MPVQPLTRAQALQNNAFLRALRRSGNVRLAARETGIAYGTVQHRRKHHPAFAIRFATAITVARARLYAANLAAATGTIPHRKTPITTATAHRTKGGETMVVRQKNGRCQVRAAQPGRLTRACEQAFLSALSATANIRLSADAAGASPRAFYRRRQKNPAFAREMRLALKMGYERIEMALLESFAPGGYEDDAWRHNDPPPVPPMNPDQAMQLMWLHDRTRLAWIDHPVTRRRRGEPTALHEARIGLAWWAVKKQEEEDRDIRRALEREGRGGSPHEPPAPVVGDLSERRRPRRT